MFSVGAVCLDAKALSGVSIVKSTARARYRNTPVTFWINYFPALLSGGVSLCGFACWTFAPYCFLTCGCGWSCGTIGGDVGIV
jgi:hypothetical protein